MNLQEMIVYRDSRSRVIDKYLMSYEGRVIAVRKHPAVLLPAASGAVGSLLACAAVSAFTGFWLVWWLWLLSLGHLVWRVLGWSIDFFLVTEHRVMAVSGIFNRNVGMAPLSKVTDITLERTPLGRILGYGDFVLETAGQWQALKAVGYVPYPEQLYLEVSSVIFGAVDGSPD
ncbi:Bacterial membrane flanked domain protein [Actinomadura rubteroloni]|uniref:Bacterial membrane flanked domain protein n=1 Tax=Actinomadura rubteroloni TaxID=1926885 RepID=A0A2P4UHK4_9ACTN|nr:Bacterial membrane flanked domain protein [Actinomadura rubteroloni]